METQRTRGPAARRRTAVRGARAGALAGLLAVLLAGCGAAGGRQAGATGAGRAFERALASGDYAAACRLLAPETLEQLEQDDRQPCPKALEDADLPVSASVGGPRVYGRQALVRAGRDRLFLSQFADGWRVVAAGCTPRGEQPYACEVKGG
ncbi:MULTISPECIES: hypothetical protein [Streptomyces]|uniref:hypothetical protein n=1 Tax=Streptomyces TaxID=1883 RepID=UPI001988F7F8|nr:MULTISPECIES: hypothetical protein [Streptomyces]GGT22866.1 hypothetical protein GCM10010286_55400 [Streptomyces toxytricini]